MARKKKPEEHENHERWLVSYADFITLLFAFFVVMYSVSSVNEGKYRVLSNSLTTAFGKSKASISPISLTATEPKTALIKSPMKNTSMSLSNPMPGIKTVQHSESEDEEKSEEDKAKAREIAEFMQALDEIAAEMNKSMKALVDDALIKVGIGRTGVEVEINSSILFPSGEAILYSGSSKTLKKIAEILKDKDYKINVEGFTDNVPINNEVYLSNWELSAGRAASVVHLFARYGVDPHNMAAIGYGEYKPASSNATAAGRKKNRRVVVVIAPKKKQRKIENNLENIRNKNIKRLGKRKVN